MDAEGRRGRRRIEDVVVVVVSRARGASEIWCEGVWGVRSELEGACNV